MVRSYVEHFGGLDRDPRMQSMRWNQSVGLMDFHNLCFVGVCCCGLETSVVCMSHQIRVSKRRCPWIYKKHFISRKFRSPIFELTHSMTNITKMFVRSLHFFPPLYCHLRSQLFFTCDSIPFQKWWPDTVQVNLAFLMGGKGPTGGQVGKKILYLCCCPVHSWYPPGFLSELRNDLIQVNSVWGNFALRK